MKDIICLIGRSQAGWHASGKVEGSTCSRTFSSSGGTLEGYLSKAPDGALVYDASEVDYGKCAIEAISGPMSNVELETGMMETGKWPPQPEPYDPARAKALTYVAVDVKVARMKLIGAKVGKVVNHQIVWEE